MLYFSSSRIVLNKNILQTDHVELLLNFHGNIVPYISGGTRILMRAIIGFIATAHGKLNAIVKKKNDFTKADIFQIAMQLYATFCANSACGQAKLSAHSVNLFNGPQGYPCFF